MRLRIRKKDFAVARYPRSRRKRLYPSLLLAQPRQDESRCRNPLTVPSFVAQPETEGAGPTVRNNNGCALSSSRDAKRSPSGGGVHVRVFAPTPLVPRLPAAFCAH